MRYLGHLALWAICGLLVVALAGAVAGGMVGGIAAWKFCCEAGYRVVRTSEVLDGVYIGAFLGAYSGAICGFIAFWVLAIPRPPLQQQGARRLGTACKFVGGFVIVGTPVLSVGLAIVGVVLMKVFWQIAPSGAILDAFYGILMGHFPLVALPVIAGAINAARALKRLEAGAARALPDSLA